MSDFSLSIVFGLCFGFLFGIGCSLAVMYSVYLGGYRKAVADSIEPAKPRRFKQTLEKVQERRTREAAGRSKSRALRPYHDTAFHDETDALEDEDVVKRIAGDSDDAG